jgi:inner membrane protein involved in colicin E2 resistance
MQFPLFMIGLLNEQRGILVMDTNEQDKISNITAVTEPFLKIPIITNYSSPPSPPTSFVLRSYSSFKSFPTPSPTPTIHLGTRPQSDRDFLLIPLSKVSTTGTTSATAKRIGTRSFDELRTVINFEAIIEKPQRLNEVLNNNSHFKENLNYSEAKLIFELHGICSDTDQCVSDSKIGVKAISDMNPSALKQSAAFKDLNGEIIRAQTHTNFRTQGGVKVIGADIDLTNLDKDPLKLNAEITVFGLETVHVIPTGLDSKITLSSPNSRIRYETGGKAPHSKTNDGGKVVASWMNTNPTDYNLTSIIHRDSVGYTYFSAIDGYRMMNRLMKYQLIISIFILVALFIFEVLVHIPLHPIQYYLIGGANCLFYLLVLSNMEHSGFGLGYLIGSAVITVLVGCYTSAILGTFKRGGLMATILGGTFGYIYVLLSLEDYALMLGSIILTAVLALVMYVSRDVDWYELRVVDKQSGNQDPLDQNLMMPPTNEP